MERLAIISLMALVVVTAGCAALQGNGDVQPGVEPNDTNETNDTNDTGIFGDENETNESNDTGVFGDMNESNETNESDENDSIVIENESMIVE